MSVTGNANLAFDLTVKDAFEISATLDTDQDSLFDIWELTWDINDDGIIDILDANRKQSDIYVEINWMEGFKPDQESLDTVQESFEKSKAGYKNKGISLHNVWGEESSHIPVLALDDISATINPYFTDEIRKHAYHCALFGDQYSQNSQTTTSSGLASMSWDQVLFVAMGCSGSSLLSVDQAAGTYMHELGHNLDLRHGGSDNLNYKPNYLSIMNYSFQFTGLQGTGKYDYSHYKLPDLDENSLNENSGIDIGGLTQGTGLGTIIHYSQTDTPTFERIAGRPYNFDKNTDSNGNDIIDQSPVSVDINGDGDFNTLSSINDWDSIVLNGGKIGTAPGNNRSIEGRMRLHQTSSKELPQCMTYDEYLKLVEANEN